mgnify:CR=1 FL=1
MTRDEIRQTLQAIGVCENDAERRTHLASLTNELEGIFTNADELATRNESLEKENKELILYNKDLFLQIGQKGEPDPVIEEGEPVEKLSYASLFNDKGELL